MNKFNCELCDEVIQTEIWDDVACKCGAKYTYHDQIWFIVNAKEVLKERCKKLVSFIPTSFTQCNGYKCREPHCISCNSEEDAREWLKDVREYIEELS